MKLYVKMGIPRQAEKFAGICQKYDFDVDVTLANSVVDGKSLMGVLTLSMTEPLEVALYNGTSEKYSEFINELKENGLIFDRKHDGK